MFLDASAIVAILVQEEGWESFEFKTASAVNLLTSPVCNVPLLCKGDDFIHTDIVIA